MLISGDTQGVAQLIASVCIVLDDQAAKEKRDQNGVAGGDLEDSKAKKARTEVCTNGFLPVSLGKAWSWIAFQQKVMIALVFGLPSLITYPDQSR